MIGNIHWQATSLDALPNEGEWVVVFDQKSDAEANSIFPAVLVITKHGPMWRDLTIPEDDVPYAPISKNCLWAYIQSP